MIAAARCYLYGNWKSVVRRFDTTFVTIDKEGKVQDLYVGYSAELRQDIGGVVRGLLEKK